MVESVGLKLAVITVSPAPVIVTVEPLVVATEVRADAYVHSPAMLTVGADRVNGASPNTLFGDGTLRLPSVGVARLMVIEIALLVSEL